MIYTNIPSAKDGKKWNPVRELKCSNRGSTVDDRWWWAFTNATDAQAAKIKIQNANINTKMRLETIVQKDIPESWL